MLFDSCWNPNPKLGPQPAPRPGVHNPGWVQSPGAAALRDTSGASEARLRTYVTGVVGRFKDDERVFGWVRGMGRAQPAATLPTAVVSRLGFSIQFPAPCRLCQHHLCPQDVWNEPDNMNDSSYLSKEPPNKVERVAALLPKVSANQLRPASTPP